MEQDNYQQITITCKNKGEIKHQVACAVNLADIQAGLQSARNALISCEVQGICRIVESEPCDAHATLVVRK